MAGPARYCARCGDRVETRTVGGRVREICPACGTVFYQNPVPVAASVVLNARREVLLVRRRHPPGEGLWCLPTGFAEVGETIAEAARRELREETGLEGRVLRLLAVKSVPNDVYGDLLFVTFEVERTGGHEAPGDDADRVAYFALDRLPPLAFSANAEAIRIGAELNREAWAIQDSFERLHAGTPAEMLSDALVTLVRDHAPEITRRWLDVVRHNPSTPTYAAIDPRTIQKRALEALSRFRVWLGGNAAHAEVRTFYHALGEERRAQGFGLPEVLSALTLLRRAIWSFARESRVQERTVDVYRVMELDRRIVLFFDKALYHTARGFHGAAPAPGRE